MSIYAFRRSVVKQAFNTGIRLLNSFNNEEHGFTSFITTPMFLDRIRTYNASNNPNRGESKTLAGYGIGGRFAPAGTFALAIGTAYFAWLTRDKGSIRVANLFAEYGFNDVDMVVAAKLVTPPVAFAYSELASVNHTRIVTTHDSRVLRSGLDVSCVGVPEEWFVEQVEEYVEAVVRMSYVDAEQFIRLHSNKQKLSAYESLGIKPNISRDLPFSLLESPYHT